MKKKRKVLQPKIKSKYPVSLLRREIKRYLFEYVYKKNKPKKG